MLNFSELSEGPSIPESCLDMTYGTSGFRTNLKALPNSMDHVAYRCGIILVSMPFLSGESCESSNEDGLQLTGDLAIGAMITASHNEYCHNGIKLFDSHGNLLENKWENMLNDVVNTRGPLDLKLKEIFESHGANKIPLFTGNFVVFVGWDTRSSSIALAKHLRSGISAMFSILKLKHAKCTFLGEITTPTIPFLLNMGILDAKNDEPYLSFIEKSFRGCISVFCEPEVKRLNEKSEALFFDCSYGVGGHKIWRFCQCLRDLGIFPYVCHSATWLNEDNWHFLNDRCGAHYVHSTGKAPIYLRPSYSVYENKRFCAFDGDSDRLIYYVASGNYTVSHILDGVCILIIKIKFMMHLLSRCSHKDGKSLRFGILVTGYTNGARYARIKSLIDAWNLEHPEVFWELKFCNNGIKNAQRAAVDYDLSIYYEANGHGNIFFDAKSIDEWLNHRADAREAASAKQLKCILNMFRSPIGDAIVNCLVVELALKVLNIDHRDFAETHPEMPFINKSVPVPNYKMHLFESCPENDSILIKPRGMQEKIDQELEKYDNCRAFIRPSGTEPVCRIYAEAPTKELAQEIFDILKGLMMQVIQ